MNAYGSDILTVKGNKKIEGIAKNIERSTCILGPFCIRSFPNF